MRRGTWHQMGDKSQVLVKEQLENGIGVGAVLSPRDLTLANAGDYAVQYRDLGASVLYDPQFHIPDCPHTKLVSYPSNAFRKSVTKLNEIGDTDLAAFARALEEENKSLDTAAVIAPAVVCEAGRPDTLALNQRLFGAAKAVGDKLGKPTFATVFLGLSATASDESLRPVFSDATGVDCDGWYFAFEFPRDRLPADEEAVYRCLRTGLELACTGKPVLHAYAGPLGLLSPGAGAAGVGIGHSQNLWKFDRERWEEPSGGAKQGGGGEAPPRFFSTSLWGTIVFPDELYQLSGSLRDRVQTMSPFTGDFTPGVWKRWDANKHFVYAAGGTIQLVANAANPLASLSEGIERLDEAIGLHAEINRAKIKLGDNTDAYQSAWRSAAVRLRDDSDGDFEFLGLMK